MRTALYFGMIALSLLAMIAAFALKRVLVPRYGDWNATLMVAGAYVVVMILIGVAMPSINEVPDEFPAVVLWNFRIASLGSQLILWGTLGLLFGPLTQRAVALRRA
jgi:predicted cobalt transporter CbtA